MSASFGKPNCYGFANTISGSCNKNNFSFM